MRDLADEPTVPTAKLVPQAETRLKKLSAEAIAQIVPCKVCSQKHIDRKGVRTCIGHTKIEGGVAPCMAPQHTVEGRCLQCAGQLRLRGRSAHDWRAGHYSERMPERLRYVFDRAAENESLVSMKYQLALVDAREVQLLERLGTGESGPQWLHLRKKAEELKEAIEAEDVTDQAKLLWEMLKVIEDGSNDDVVWAEIQNNAEFRRKLTETERKHIESERAQMSYEQIGQIAAFIGNLLKRYVTDPARLESAAVELARYFDGTPVATVPAASSNVIDAEPIEDTDGD